MKIKKTCKICGYRFELKKENKYLAHENKNVSDVFTETHYIYECFDCPECGCQLKVNIRMPQFFDDDSK